MYNNFRYLIFYTGKYKKNDFFLDIENYLSLIRLKQCLEYYSNIQEIISNTQDILTFLRLSLIQKPL